MGRDPALPDSPEWPIETSETEYETGWYDGGYDLVEQPDGSRRRYYWASLSTAVVVVPVVDDHVVLVEQYRPTIRRRQLELPAGIVESGEAFVEAARRELREETGYRASSCSLLQELWVATGVLRHERGVVFAEGLTEGATDRDEDEFLSVRRIPVDEVIERVRTTSTNDATLNGLLLASEDGLLD